MKSPGALTLSTRTALIMAVFAMVFTALMAGAYLVTRPVISRSTEQEKLRLINEVLPPSSYDNDLLADVLALPPTSALGLDKGGHVWRARKQGRPVALVLEAAAPDGYGGRIALIVAVLADGTVSGVRVTAHHETPGLGDYIDPKKDKNKSSPWIEQFAGISSTQLPLERWTVKKDGGDFTYRTGATISARAVTQAVGRAVKYANDNRERLFAQGTQP
ncbi:electron transport complex subunit RsxG [Uliginosibacterium sp. sgz301328]|uniref:electron transport complex subunit RsxG n=1 Tax=Uliginosibacterium sp. sgz301328 TaxID=3243764 RepID=UPI00359F0D15